MLNKKAQALVEFVLLLPIILLIIFSSIDVFNLLLKKQELINIVDDEVKLVENGKETVVDFEKKLEKDKIDISFIEEDDYLTIEISKKIDWISPITDMILSNYNIKLKRVIPYE